MKSASPQQIIPGSDQESQHLVTEASCFHAAPRLSFEDTQAFLKRAAAQLEVGDQSQEEARDRMAAMGAEITRMWYEKSIRYNYPISQECKLEYQMLNMSMKKLAKIIFQLSLTPTGVAARYIAWLHESIGTDAPNPLSGWLKELDTEIKERHHYHDPHRLFRKAEHGVFALVGLYASALLAWIEDASATMSLDAMATACTIAGAPSNAELAARLAEQMQHLRIWATVLTLIERDYLMESVLPAAMRSALECGQLRLRTDLAGSASESAASTAEAQSRVKTLFANACAGASLFRCHQVVLSLAAAIRTYSNRLRDHELAMSTIEAAWGRPAPVENSSDRATQQRQPNKRIKPRGSATAATSATQQEEAKTGGIKGMAS